MKIDLRFLKFDSEKLLPAIVQDMYTGEMIMLRYMNEEALLKTVETGHSWFWYEDDACIREVGTKEEFSQKITSISSNKEGNTLLLQVEQEGPVNYNGSYSEFTEVLWDEAIEKNLPVVQNKGGGMLAELYRLVLYRKAKGGDSSYTARLFSGGQDTILRKLSRESTETLLASKNNAKEDLVCEMGELWYHCMVLLAYHNVSAMEMMRGIRNGIINDK